ncbi:formate dehydrogenase [Yimella sp. cx-51]|nr:formate dehydrogenase [Yimella sp. cx-51]
MVMNIVELIEEAGLTGRGGAAFSTARKVRLAQDHRARLIVNACDGEIGAAKDAWIVRHQLRELIDGAMLFATSTTPIFAAHRDSETARLLIAAGLDVLQVPHRYVSSEESALVNLLHGNPARPVTKRYPIAAGGQTAQEKPLEPTLVLNAETVWLAGRIVASGVGWFRSFGTADEPGPRLVTVSAVGRPPVVLPTAAGEPITSLLARAGMDRDYLALNIGGLGGGFVAAKDVSSMTWSGRDLTPHGLFLGPGVIRVLPADTCPWVEISALVRYAAGESAGQCGPCIFGLPAISEDLDALVGGTGGSDVLDRLSGRVGLLPGRGACRFPDGVGRFVASALQVFGAELRAHQSIGCQFSAVTGPIHTATAPLRRSA